MPEEAAKEGCLTAFPAPASSAQAEASSSGSGAGSGADSRVAAVPREWGAAGSRAAGVEAKGRGRAELAPPASGAPEESDDAARVVSQEGEADEVDALVAWALLRAAAAEVPSECADRAAVEGSPEVEADEVNSRSTCDLLERDTIDRRRAGGEADCLASLAHPAWTRLDAGTRTRRQEGANQDTAKGATSHRHRHRHGPQESGLRVSETGGQGADGPRQGHEEPCRLGSRGGTSGPCHRGGGDRGAN